MSYLYEIYDESDKWIVIKGEGRWHHLEIFLCSETMIFFWGFEPVGLEINFQYMMLLSCFRFFSISTCICVIYFISVFMSFPIAVNISWWFYVCWVERILENVAMKDPVCPVELFINISFLAWKEWIWLMSRNRWSSNFYCYETIVWHHNFLQFLKLKELTTASVHLSIRPVDSS